MQDVIAHLINEIYHFYQGRIFPRERMMNASHFIFGGFQLSYD